MHVGFELCILKLRASYSGQVDEFRNPMKTELKTRPCLKAVFLQADVKILVRIAIFPTTL